MLVGNPDNFAIWCDAVDLWSTDHFKNGCFAYFVGGELLWSLKSTIAVDLNLLSGLNCLKHSVEDVRLFNLPTSSAYSELVARAFPPMDSDAADSDYSHLVSIGSLLDDDNNVFLVESGEQAKLIFGRRSEMPTPREVILTRGEFQSVVHDLIAKSKNP
ncbi:immunity 42 family protein [Burkholderia sp. 22PA0099]|uniref:immunity 42 family protein n=1 Tax=Burkholderia sp. 22PA0099 TaxID=3237372 RepID=UPI0039C46574